MTYETTTRTIRPLELLGVWATETIRAADAMKAKCEDQDQLDRVQPIIDEFRGKATGYLDAQALMKKELQRLCNLHQNGILTVSDFGIVL